MANDAAPLRTPSRLTWLNTAFLALQAVMGAYLYLVPDRTTFVFSQVLVLAHVVTCLVWLPFFVWWVAVHTWTRFLAKRLLAAFTNVHGLLGILLLVAVLFGFGSGFPLLSRGAGMPLASFHAIAGLLVLLPFAVHLWLEHKKLLFVMTVALCAAGLVSVAAVKGAVAGDSEKPATPKFTYQNQPMAAYDNAAWCGSCHTEVYQEWNSSTHRRTIQLDFVKKSFKEEGEKTPGSTTVDLTDWGKMIHGDPDLTKNMNAKMPFLACAACHAPLAFYAGFGKTAVNAPEPVSDGITCAFCHTARGFGGGSMNLDPVFAGVRATGKFDNHQLMQEIPFYISGPQTVRRYLWQNDSDPLRRWVGDMLIRWRPEMHARDYHPDFLNTSLLCHGCHGFQGETKGAPGRAFDTWAKGQYNDQDPAKRTECQDCHMARRPDGHPVHEPGKLVPWAPTRPQRRYHYFLGGNVGAAAPHDDVYIKAERDLRLKGIAFTLPKARIADGVLEVDVALHNRLNAHYFPAYETKRRWAWVELAVTDANGKEVAHSKPGPKVNTDLPGCCRAGMDPIVYFRVATEGMEILADTIVPADQTRTDVAKLALPPNPVLPLKVTATLWHNCDTEPVTTAHLTVP